MITETFRLLSYNVRKSVGLDGRRMPGRILDVINQSEADIVLLQEADKRLGERPASLDRRLIEQSSDYDVVPLAPNDVSLGWHGNAILLRRGVPVHRTQRLELPGLEPRGAVLLEVATSDNDRVTIVGAHLGLLRSWRRLQLARIVESIEASQWARSIIAGDFNEWSEERGLEALSGYYSVISPGKSFHANWPLAALDRIAVGGAIEPVAAGVDETPRARVSSDHLPIWADVRLAASDGGHALEPEGCALAP